jgi:ABC-type nitrate/sulfonate/bicarbonate transport system substrate-binding protein
VAQGNATVLIRPDDIPSLKGFPYLALTVTQADLQNRFNLVVAAVKSYTQGIQLLVKSPDKAKPIEQKRFSNLTADAFEPSFTSTVAALPATPVISKDQFKVVLTFYEAIGQKLTLSYEQVIDPKASQQAARELGIK